MYQRIINLLFIIILFGCTPSKKDNTDIEIISYHWNSYGNVPWHIDYHMYAIIDITGKGIVSVDKMGKNVYCEISIDKTLIKKVINSSEFFFSDSAQSYKEIFKDKMDDPNLKIRVNNSNNNGIISYWKNDRVASIQNFVILFNLIDSLYMSDNYKIINDTFNIFQKRNKFINDVIRIDTTFFPPPPPAIEQEKINY
jgi:hypothetical protein